MRVALVNLTTTSKLGGVETFVWQLGRSLAARGIDVTIFGGAAAGAVPLDAANVKVVTTPYVERALLRRVPPLARQYTATKLLERLTYALPARGPLERGAFDIVHIHKPFDFPLAAYLRARGRTRIVYSSHGRDFFPGDRRFVPAIDVFTACSRYNAADVRTRYGREARVIFNGVDTSEFAPQAPARAESAAFAPTDAPVALWAGRLVRWKGTIDAIRAVALAQSPIHLAIVGSGPEEGRLRQAAEALGVDERVHFLGNRPHAEMASLFRASNVVVGTSFANETFGMTLAEASASGVPVIATNFGGFPEVVRDGETGILVPPRDPPHLAAALDALADDPATAARMGVAGRAFVTREFAWPVVSDRVMAAYDEARRAD